MPVLKKLTLLSVPFAAFAVLAAPAASAETLIYVTGTTIGTVDSSSPGVDNTSGNNGPLSYSLPSGFNAIGAKVSSDNATLFLLASDGGVCQLFSVNTTGNSSGQAALTEVNGSYGCSTATGNGDFGFLNGSGGSSGLDAYLVANGADILEVVVGGGSTSSLEIGNPNGGVGNIQGVVSVGTSPNDIPYAADASTQELVELNLNTGAEINVNALPFTFAGSTSLDYSTASGNFYLYTNGALYSDSITYGVDSSSLGNLPSGTLAVTVAGNVGVSNSNSGGAFAPALLLPLGALAFLRRRRARSVCSLRLGQQRAERLGAFRPLHLVGAGSRFPQAVRQRVDEIIQAPALAAARANHHPAMNEQPSQNPQAPDSRRGAMVGLLIVLGLIVGGLFLVHVLRTMSQVQDCAMSGRTNCAPIDSTSSGN